ncbi:MAG TPA: elongation factor G [Firmicutes bacterium]|nr:elongation factor G [Bacillota bacterium]
MKQYTSEHIKNVALAGHGNAGKTSLAEALLFLSGATDRLGKTSEGNTVCDFDAEEIRRVSSVSTAVAPLEYKNTKINLIDTPGLFDFEGGFREGTRPAESVLICVSGKSGVSVGTEKAYEQATKNAKAHMFYVSKLDRESADFYKVLEELKSTFGPTVCPLVVPYVEERKVVCYINLIDMKAYEYDEQGKATEVAMPDTGHRLDGLIAAISEAVAESDEQLFEKYFSGEQFTREEMIQGIRVGVKNGNITPVICGSALTLAAVDLLLDLMDELLPNASEASAEFASDESGETIAVECNAEQPFASYVFKTVADPFVGKISYVKVVTGTLKSDTPLFNMRTGQPERMGKLVFLHGKKQEDTPSVCAGDICAITKLASTLTGDTLCDPKRKLTFEEIGFPKPCYSMAIRPKAKGDEAKIAQGLAKLIEEDPTLSFEINNETHQQILSGLGEQHLEVAMSKLRDKFGVDMDLEPPKVAYRETIRKKVKVQGKHKKQTGGHGQFGDVWIEFEPCDSEELVFAENVFGGAVPRNFFPAVEKGLRDSAQRGVLAGYPVVGLKATLVDGSYHPVDSSEMAFKTAASLAYKAGLAEASPVLLEPIGELHAVIPDANTGDLMGEVTKRRGRVLGMNPVSDGVQEIIAEVPMAQMHDFTTYLRSTTQGRGSFELNFVRYEQVPSNLEASIIEAAKEHTEE